MRKIKDNIISLSFMSIIPIINIFYGYLNNTLRGVHSLVTDVDRNIPFLKIFVIPYLAWYPFIILTLTYFCVYHRKIYCKVLATLIIGMLVSYVIFFFFQTTVPRPKLVGNGFLISLVRFVYKTDNPFNCFPSIHVITSYAMIKGINKSGTKKFLPKFTILVTAVLVIISTQFIKQHVILDMIFAILLVEGIYRLLDSPYLERYIVMIKLYWRLIIKKKIGVE